MFGAFICYLLATLIHITTVIAISFIKGNTVYKEHQFKYLYIPNIQTYDHTTVTMLIYYTNMYIHYLKH